MTLNAGTLAAGAAGGTIGGLVQAGNGPHTIAPGLVSGYGTLNLNGGLNTNSHTTLSFNMNLGSPIGSGTNSLSHLWRRLDQPGRPRIERRRHHRHSESDGGGDGRLSPLRRHLRHVLELGAAHALRRQLAYLVLNRARHVGRDELIDALWPNQPPVSQDAALRTCSRACAPRSGPRRSPDATSSSWHRPSRCGSTSRPRPPRWRARSTRLRGRRAPCLGARPGAAQHRGAAARFRALSRRGSRLRAASSRTSQQALEGDRARRPDDGGWAGTQLQSAERTGCGLAPRPSPTASPG